MLINILSFLKALYILIGDQTRGETPVCFFFSREPTVPTVKGITVHFYDNSQATRTLRAVISPRSVRPGETTARRVATSSLKVELFKFVIREFIGLLKTFRRQNIALNMWKIVKKRA